MYYYSIIILFRTWVTESLNSAFENHYPKQSSIKLTAPRTFYDGTSKLFLKGKFNSATKISDAPAISFKISKLYEFFHFEFIPGSKDTSHSYAVWSTTNGINNSISTVVLSDYDKNNPEFNITITFDEKLLPNNKLRRKFKVKGQHDLGLGSEYRSGSGSSSQDINADFGMNICYQKSIRWS